MVNLVGWYLMLSLSVIKESEISESTNVTGMVIHVDYQPGVDRGIRRIH